MSKKVVIISTVYPFPIDNGKKVVLSGFVNFLMECFGPENLHYILVGCSPERQQFEAPFKLHILDKPNFISQIKNTLFQSLIKGTKSIQESMLYSKEIRSKLHSIVKEINPEIVIYDTFRIGQFFETGSRFGQRHILYMDDLFSVRYGRMLEILDKFPNVQMNPLGNFSRFVPAGLRSIVDFRMIQKTLLRLEQRLTERRERQCVRWFDKNLLISAEEASKLKKNTKLDHIYEIKPHLPEQKILKRNFNGDPVFVFLGALNIPHNQYSLIYFLNSQMHRILERMPNAKLRIIGKGAGNNLKSMVNKYEGSVTIEGFVEDLSTLFSESCAMIIPLLFGSGVKIKTLEALAYGLPVITTKFGVEGISITTNSGCIVEDNLNQYPQIMESLCDLDRNKKMSEQATSFFATHYKSDVVLKLYEELFVK